MPRGTPAAAGGRALGQEGAAQAPTRPASPRPLRWRALVAAVVAAASGSLALAAGAAVPAAAGVRG
ncbi:MAG TPA: serine/threonine protein kinase, partial [Acidimicrobiia bacterium]|nr:serine/threonine protein kinase [Acidimicrobiia bacterium]